MPDIPYSCPHFDEAKSLNKKVREHFDTLSDLLDEADDEIEKARDINSLLRAENETLTEQLDEALSRIKELEEINA